MQFHIALQMDCARQEFPGGNRHAPAARLRARVNRVADRLGRIRPSIRHRAEFGDVEIARGKLRCHDARKDFRHLRPFRRGGAGRQRQA